MGMLKNTVYVYDIPSKQMVNRIQLDQSLEVAYSQTNIWRSEGSFFDQNLIKKSHFSTQIAQF